MYHHDYTSTNKKQIQTNANKQQTLPDIIDQSVVSYIHVDSGYRIKYPTIIPDNKLYNLPPYPIYFTNGSGKIIINLPNHSFQIDDKIILNNVNSKNVILQNVLMVKKNSFFLRIFHQHHGLSMYGLYNPSNENEFVKINHVHNLPTRYNESDDIPDGLNEYYILKNNSKMNYSIQLSNIKGSDITRSLIGNIATNYLNRKHIVYTIFIKNGTIFESDPNSYLIALEKKSSINYADNVNLITNRNGATTQTVVTNTIYIKFHNLFGIPLNYLNSGLPITEDVKYPYMTVIDKTKDTIVIDVGYPAIVDPDNNFYHQTDFVDNDINFNNYISRNVGGGNQCYVRKIIKYEPGYPKANNYSCKLNKIYKNIIQAKIIGSIFPNSQKIINDRSNDVINNKLYWRNLTDGDYIYQLSITPGTYYPPQQLKEAIEAEFNHTIRYQYTQEFASDFVPSIIESATPIDNHLYDDSGYNKYHIVTVDISETTGIVSLSSFREIIQYDNSLHGPVLSIPNNLIEFSMAGDLRFNFGTNLSHPNLDVLVPQVINPFDPITEELFIYFTPNSHCRIQEKFPYVYFNLYKYIKHIQPNSADGYNTFLAKIETKRSVLLNFHRIKLLYPCDNSIQELGSINTITKLVNFIFNYLTSEVQLSNHNLNIGDLMITDQFIDPSSLNEIFVYEVINIINSEKVVVKKYNHGEKYKFIYDSIILNFGSCKDSQFWLDQIMPNEKIQSGISNGIIANNTLSFTSIIPQFENHCMLHVRHLNHQLDAGSVIIISNSLAINSVPALAINKQHIINKIIDDNHYEIIIDMYTPETIINNSEQKKNIVLIKYPDLFQLSFEYSDTMGKLLGFDKIGEKTSITPYKHTITNVDNYMNDLSSPGFMLEFSSKKLNMSGYNYFYICSPELSCIHNTSHVSNVFAIVYWIDNPGGTSVNSYVATTKFFDIPLSTLSEIHFSIHHPDGRLIEFNGLDHSFTIEITELTKQIIGIPE